MNPHGVYLTENVNKLLLGSSASFNTLRRKEIIAHSCKRCLHLKSVNLIADYERNDSETISFFIFSSIVIFNTNISSPGCGMHIAVFTLNICPFVHQ
jgi:hypothetical protein